MAEHVAMDLAKFEVAREVWEAGLSEGSEPCDRVAESICGKERRGYSLTMRDQYVPVCNMPL